MGLFTSVVVCIFVCVLFIKVDAGCWIHCPDYQYSGLQPYCYLNDEEGDQSCYITVSTSELIGLKSRNLNKINLFINVTHSVFLRLRNELFDYGLELRAFRNIDQVTKLEIFNNLIMSHCTLHNLPNLRYIYCVRVSFPHFPSFSINSELTYLDVSQYTLLSNDPKIRSEHFSGLSNLKYLGLYPLNGGKLTNSAFTGLTTLTRIDLRNIVIFDYVITLSPLVRLKRLTIQDCGVSDISFLKQTPGLYGLTYISFYSNNIKSFPADTFKNYTQLKILDIGYNSISVINRFYSKKLQTLYLHYNQITQVPEDTFRDTPLLTTISLGVNNITKLSSRTFEHLYHLRDIWLYKHPLHCDCSLKWMYKVTQEYGIRIYDTLCATPPQHEGISALNSSLYTNCDEELSYQCFDRTISCPVGSYCQDTRDSYKCVCEGEGVAFSRTLNQCVDYEAVIASESCCQRCLSNNKGQAVFLEP